MAQLSIMTVGSALAALKVSFAATVLAVMLIGVVLAPLGTYFSLILDELAPPPKRPEVFALLRTANAVGVIFASAIIAALSVSIALILVTSTTFVATLAATICVVQALRSDDQIGTALFRGWPVPLPNGRFRLRLRTLMKRSCQAFFGFLVREAVIPRTPPKATC
ncbi:hypothetical protein ACIQUG_33695 [Ensifer sp. NPDC090286]|uniref:hypothetical protein n=1 Tax=Ensifer sp. NPDC090286 TaxID=3363991 RepID=UPI003839F169